MRRAGAEETKNEGAGLMRWLLTYADLITLLMAFFVVLYAISRVNRYKFEVLSRELRIAFNGRPAVIQLGHHPPADLVPTVRSGAPTPLNLLQHGQASSAYKFNVQSLAQLYYNLETLIRKDHLGHLVSVRVTSTGITIVLLQHLLFALGSAHIKSSALPVLARIAHLLSQLPNQVVVRGYTDNLPIHTAQFPSNWELSAARALAVLHVLRQDGVPPTQLQALAEGQWHPVASNSTPQGRQQNRRVEIAVLTLGTQP